ncbi:MAG TPA: T9SS type A sorting domain-containing protein [Chitinophagaceae bacterium]
MRTILIALFLCLCARANTQTVCGIIGEGGTLNMTAPVGTTFISVSFASYGTPNGSCGSFTVGGCHASNSMAIVQSYLVGYNSADIPATNTVFGDPCGGTVKRLYVEAIYSLLAPLKLISFSGSTAGNKNLLTWETSNEINTLEFEIEHSNNGLVFSKKGTVTANNRSGSNSYSYAELQDQPGTHFYRLKMVDQDGKFNYSNILKLSTEPISSLTVFPNPATGSITLSGLQATGVVEIITIQGEVMKRKTVTAQTQVINIEEYPTGVYIVKYSSAKTTSSRMIVKR